MPYKSIVFAISTVILLYIREFKYIDSAFFHVIRDFSRTYPFVTCVVAFLTSICKKKMGPDY